jgi:aldehyde:ferredoxin oxidoreductase
MSITPLPNPPLRSDGPANFADNAEIFLSQLPTFAIEANALEANVNAKEISATNQADAAIASAGIATNMATIATASANYKGLWSSLIGALNMPASVYHNGGFWALNANLSNVTTETPGVSASWTRIKFYTDVYSYENRGNLRGLNPLAGDQAIIDGLGLFVYAAGSDEPDDDESCFATASGRWLLQAAHWDLVDAWQSPDDAVRDEDDEDEPLRFATKVLTGSATCAITSVAAVASTSFTGTVTGAAVGDRVIATPPAQLGSTAAETGKLSYHAWVSAANTVTIALTNASAASATTNASIQVAWPITVIKS